MCAKCNTTFPTDVFAKLLFNICRHLKSCHGPYAVSTFDVAISNEIWWIWWPDLATIDSTYLTMSNVIIISGTCTSEHVLSCSRVIYATKRSHTKTTLYVFARFSLFLVCPMIQCCCFSYYFLLSFCIASASFMDLPIMWRPMHRLKTFS